MRVNNQALRQKTAAALAGVAGTLKTKHAVIGFDGFVDEIARLVDKRQSPRDYLPIPTLAKLAERIAGAAGKSANIEMVVQQMKLGGNGPIMANALASFGVQVTYIGNLGYPNIHPVFADLATRAQVISIAEPGHTDALEFEDGKLMLGKVETLNEITYENLRQRIGEQEMAELFEETSLIGLTNWTMIAAMDDIWKNILERICPRMRPAKNRLAFFDLADPAKRVASDICAALEWISRFQEYFQVILGLNEKESLAVAGVLGIEAKSNSPDSLQELAAALRDRLRVHCIVIHPVQFATVATATGGAKVAGPWDPKPLISTGAGDHFNAGFCLGALLGFDEQTCLLTGVATSGFYVRTAKSPTVGDLVQILRHWPA